MATDFALRADVTELFMAKPASILHVEAVKLL